MKMERLERWRGEKGKQRGKDKEYWEVKLGKEG